MPLTRRRLLIGGGAVLGGGLLVGFTALNFANSAARARATKLAARDGAYLLAGWVTIAPDDAITVLIPHADFGQGIHTALAMMLAEELDAEWSKVRAVQAPADEAFANWFLAESYTLKSGVLLDSGLSDPLFQMIARRVGLQLTGGSTAVRFTGAFGMRHVGAAAREMLVRTAAQRWDVSPRHLSTRDSVVFHAASGRQLRYGELVAAAAELAVPSRPSLKRRQAYRLLGRSLPRPDVHPKVVGTHPYGVDVRLPNLRYATSKAAPVHGGRLLSVDAAPAFGVPGVEHVLNLPDSVAVVAREPWQAFKALALLAPRFSTANAEHVSTQSLYAEQLVALEKAERMEKLKIGAAAQVLSRAARTVESVYRAPFLHHAQMEPINITGQWQAGHLTIWAGVQDPLTARRFSAQIAGLPIESVTLHSLPLGGAFGRRTGPDEDSIWYRQIVAIAKACSPHPVKLIWSREEDTAQGWYRPLVSTRLAAALDADGMPSAWSQVFIEGRPGRSITYPIPYEIPQQLFEEVARPNHVRRGPLRSVNSTQHGFWRECFIDELAQAARRDPIDYRLALLRNEPRARRVLQAAALRSDWKRPLPPGVGRGIALHIEYGTVLAAVVEASWQRPRVQLHRVVAVVDCGERIHPDTAAQQIEGGLIMGLSNAICEEITIAGGAVVEKQFSDYRLLTLADIPDIEVHFLDSDAPPGGLGEAGVPPATPALGNALFSATGLRARHTPFNAALSDLDRD